MSTHVDGTLPASHQYWQAWTDEASPRAVVVLVHGVHEHSGRYAHVAERFVASGIELYGVDHPGHGRSPGTPGNIGSMSATVAGVHELAQLAQGRRPGVPTFVYGHSLGGLIALQYISGTPIPLVGAIISAPAVDTSAAKPTQVRAAGLISRLAPNLGVIALDPTAVSRDPEVVRIYRTDPLNRMAKIRARTGAELLNAVKELGPRLATVQLPLYLVHGTADRLVPVSATDWVAQHVASSDVTVRMWDGLFHEVHNEPEQASVLDELVAWLEAHLPG